MESKISVIVPVFNSIKTIERLAKSLSAQTDDDYEVLFVNDGSTDGSKQFLEDYCLKENKFRVVSKKNGGAGMARNYGIERTKGDYICFVDSDDVVSPNYVKQLRKIAINNHADVVCVKYVRNIKKNFEKLSDSCEVLSGEKAIDALLQMRIDNGPVAKLFSRAVIGDNRMPNAMVAEDLFFNYEVMKNANKVILNDSLLYSYIETEGSLSTKSFSPERMDSLEVVRKIDAKEKSFYSKARVFMEAYFICELIVLAKATKVYSNEYKKVCNILNAERSAILKDSRATKRQKLIARLLKFGPKMTVKVMTFKRRLI